MKSIDVAGIVNQINFEYNIIDHQDKTDFVNLDFEIFDEITLFRTL